jgi:hypothetical protein
MLSLETLRNTPVKHDPYDYVVVKDFVPAAALDSIGQDFPDVPGPGSHPTGVLKIRGAFADLLAEMEGASFRALIEKKFDVDLSGRPTMYTVRGYCRANDGKIHTDSETKIITVLLYLNDRTWKSDGGRLRILRDGTDLENFADEVDPVGGTLLVFKRSDKSWHGHHSYEGPRRAIQMNWVTTGAVARKEAFRHTLSTWTKRIKSLSFS